MGISRGTLDKILEEQIEQMADIAYREDVDDAVKCEAAKAVAMLINVYCGLQNGDAPGAPQNVLRDIVDIMRKRTQ